MRPRVSDIDVNSIRDYIEIRYIRCKLCLSACQGTLGGKMLIKPYTLLYSTAICYIIFSHISYSTNMMKPTVKPMLKLCQNTKQR
jgi:hypothetical protein